MIPFIFYHLRLVGFFVHFFGCRAVIFNQDAVARWGARGSFYGAVGCRTVLALLDVQTPTQDSHHQSFQKGLSSVKSIFCGLSQVFVTEEILNYFSIVEKQMKN